MRQFTLIVLLGVLFAGSEPTWLRGQNDPTKGPPPNGDALARTVPALVEALKDADPMVRTYAADALCSLDKRALPALIDLLGGKDGRLRAEAAMIIGKMGVRGRRHLAALPALTAALKDKDVTVRRAAAYAISQISVVGLK